MKRKWEYIADECRKKNFDCAAIVADQIDQELLRIYGNIHTPEWIRDYGILDEYAINDIASENAGEYCIACHIHIDDCDACVFARQRGDECNTTADPGESLFGEFFDEYDNDK